MAGFEGSMCTIRTQVKYLSNHSWYAAQSTKHIPSLLHLCIATRLVLYYVRKFQPKTKASEGYGVQNCGGFVRFYALWIVNSVTGTSQTTRGLVRHFMLVFPFFGQLPVPEDWPWFRLTSFIEWMKKSRAKKACLACFCTSIVCVAQLKKMY